jgi:hypothetical protein
MKIPEYIRISGIEYSINLVPDLNDGRNVLLGEISHGRAEILIKGNEHNYQRQCVTLWHEIFHAIQDIAGLSLGEDKDEEHIIDTFAFAVYQILQDNGRRLFDIADPKSDDSEANEGTRI